MPAIEIRPRRATELVDAGFQIFRRYYPQLFTMAAIAMSPSVFARVLMRDTLSDPTAIMSHRGPVFGGILIISLCTILADAVLIVAASDGYLEGNVDLARALKGGVSRVFGVIAAGIVRYLFVFLLAMVMAVASVVVTAAHAQILFIVLVPLAGWLLCYFLLRTFAASNVVLLEGAGPMEAVTRSWRLSQGCGAHVFFSLGLLWMLYLVVYFVAAGIGTALFSRSIAEIIGAIVIVAIYPLVSVVYTLLYYDLRVRKEGFDLEVMSRALGGAGGDTPGASPLPAA